MQTGCILQKMIYVIKYFVSCYINNRYLGQYYIPHLLCTQLTSKYVGRKANRITFLVLYSENSFLILPQRYEISEITRFTSFLICSKCGHKRYFKILYQSCFNLNTADVIISNSSYVTISKSMSRERTSDT